MSYRDRLQPKITLTSPSGQVFDALWIGDSITTEKQVGIFKTPGVAGVVTQDLNIGAKTQPTTIYFDGPDNDIESERLNKTMAESGPWVVIHPVKGELILQPLSIVESVQPVASGNVTANTIEWIEVTGKQGVKSAGQLEAEAKAQNVVLSETSADQLLAVVGLDTADKTGFFKNAVDNIVTAYDSTIGAIVEGVAEVSAQATSIKRGIDSTLGAAVIDVLSVAGQIQALVNLPNLIVTDLTAKAEIYSRFADNILALSPETSSPAGINTAAVQELALTAGLGAVGVASVITPLNSRQDVINNVESTIDLFETITNGLDEIQEIYSDEVLSRAYFSQSTSFADSALMTALTVAYLIKSAFDLSVEKRILLTKAENPVMIAMREYGGPGDNDANIDFFNSSNNLTGSELYILNAGREVVVYL